MKKMKVLAAVTITAVLAGTVTGCGNDNVSATLPKKETENEVEYFVKELMSPIVDGMSKMSSMSVVSVDEATNKAVETEEPKPQDVQAENGSAADTIASNKTESNQSAANDSNSGGSSSDKSTASDSGSSSSSKSKSSGSGSGSSGSSNSGSGNPSSGSSGSSNSAPTSAPHTHNWKEHTASRQVWVPNMVTVDDYEDQVVKVGYYECDCGYRVNYDEGEEGFKRFTEHMETSILNATKNGTLDSCLCGGSMVYEWNETKKVKVGSHEEDHGHYENETYVDYYYCDCGARK